MAEILIVDDEPFIRGEIGEALARAGHEVREAGNGIEAAEALRERTPDVLVTDILMPEMDGIEMIHHVLREHRRVKIVAISSGGPRNYSDYLKYAANFGADRVLPKPLDIDELVAVVAELAAAPAGGRE